MDYILSPPYNQGGRVQLAEQPDEVFLPVYPYPPCGLKGRRHHPMEDSKYRALAYSDPDEMVFGKAVFPVCCGFDVQIGRGEVLPELKYSPRPGTEASLDTLSAEYRRITQSALDRALALGLPAVVLELEHVFQLTWNPEWGAEITRQTFELLEDYYSRYGLRSALRVTVADIRQHQRHLRDGFELYQMFEAFEQCARAGAHLLSIESTGGKEVFNHCLTRQDIAGVLFSVGVLGSRDMAFLWSHIVEIAERYGALPAGDTDCAHAGSAMFLAGGLLDHQISHTFAALVRAIGAARSLVAFEQGASGPDKDCGFEGPILKAITGRPTSMEGKTSACANMTLMGNIAAAVCDLWSNEAVEYGEMFGGTTPQVFLEILGYDVAQMNTALQMGTEKVLRDILVQSDIGRDPQAFILAPATAFEIAKAIVSEEDEYRRARSAGLKAAELIEKAYHQNLLVLSQFEYDTLRQCADTLQNLPEDPEEFLRWGLGQYSSLEEFHPENYGLRVETSLH